MAHATIRAVTAKTIVQMIADKYLVNEDTALKMFYESDVGEAFSDDETGLYGQSATYIFNLFDEAIKRDMITS